MAVPNIVYHSEIDLLSNLDFMRGATFAHLYSSFHGLPRYQTQPLATVHFCEDSVICIVIIFYIISGFEEYSLEGL